MSKLARALLHDSEILVEALVCLSKVDTLTPERLAAIADRLKSHIADLRELVEDEPPLEFVHPPQVAMRFHGPFGVIDGGRP